MSDRYILKDGIAIPCPDLMTWACWLADNRNRWHRTDTVGGMRLSTIFLGLDFNHGTGDPLLWETMLFNDDEAHEVVYRFDGEERTYINVPDLGQWRFSFKDEAYQFHDEKLIDLQAAFDAAVKNLFHPSKES